MPDESTTHSSSPGESQGAYISAEEVERILLARLQACAPNELDDCLWELARFYSQTGRQPMALQYLGRLRAGTTDLEKLASTHLAQGQMMEQLGDFASAVMFYSQALSLEPTHPRTWYFINNNLGYSLNQLGRFAEAEAYCQAAIATDPQRHNAYKNVGAALEGQGQWAEAVRHYIRAVKANAADPRALRLLEKLVAAHPELLVELPDLAEQVQRCRAAVQAASELRKGARGA